MTPSTPPRAAAARRFVPGFESLEDRTVPAITFQFNYSLDTSGFFNDPARRASLEQAGADLAARIASTPDAITPAGNNTWQAVFNDPVTGNQDRLTNLSVPAGVLVVFVGGTNLTGTEAGQGGPGGYWVSGTSSFQHAVATRGQAGFATWGGSLSVDNNQNWYFGSDPNGIPNGAIDFYSVASHELTHLLGFGTSQAWDNLDQNGKFVGAMATAVAGSAPSISPDGAHFAQDTHSPGCNCPACRALAALAAAGKTPVSMQPTLVANVRVPTSELDYAALADLGWAVTGLTAAAATTAAPTSAATPETGIAVTTGTTGTAAAATVTTGTPAATGAGLATAAPSQPSAQVAGLAAGQQVTAVAGPTDGSVQLYTSGADGTLTAHGSPFQPFGDFGGAVRVAVGDVNGDGVPDVVVGTGPGGGSLIRVFNGATMTDLVPEFSAYEASFDGGVFVATGDFDRDGKAEVVVTPDEGGGSRVRVFKLDSGSAQVAADFFGIADPNFRGGARAAVGDVNGDGTPDLIIAAGYGGGPRVSVVDGATVLSGHQSTLVPDFFAFEPGLRNGVYVTAGDVDGDGRADLTFGAGPGGAPRVMTISGRTLTESGPAAALAAPLANVFAGSTDDRSGVRVAARDLNGDGKDEVLAGSGSDDTARVFEFTAGGLVASSVISPFATDSGATDGVYVG